MPQRSNNSTVFKYLDNWAIFVDELITNYTLALKLAANEYLANIFFGQQVQQPQIAIAG